MRSAVTLVALGIALSGCETLKKQMDQVVVPKVVEAPQSPGPDECIEYHRDFPELKPKAGSVVLPPSEFLNQWNGAKKSYRALNRDHSVCRAWRLKRRTQINVREKKGKPSS